MCYLAAQSATNATINHGRYWILPQRIRAGLNRERRTPGKAYAGVVASAGIGIYAEALTHHALSLLHLFLCERLDAALCIQSAFALRHNHLGTFFLGRQSLSKHIAHSGDIICVSDGLYPFHAHTAHRIGNRLSRGADGILRLGRKYVLSAGGCGVTVVHHYKHTVSLIENRVPHTAGQPVVPETAIAHKADGALLSFRSIECGRAGPTQAV